MAELKLPAHFTEDDVASADSENRVAVHYAAATDDIDTFEKILMKDKSLINASDNSGQTPIFVACINGNVTILNALIHRGVPVDQFDNERHSIVHWAVVCGQLECLSILIKAGASVMSQDMYGAYPLHYAIVIEDKPEETCLSILHLLIRAGNNVDLLDIDERTPALWSASHGNFEAMKILFSAGANKHHLDRDRLSILHCATSHGHNEILLYLLKSVDRKMIKLRDRNGDTALFFAAAFGHYDCAKTLLKYKADPNVQDYRLRTPSHCAAAKGHLRILQLLRANGASFNLTNFKGDLPFHEAVQGRSSLHLATATGSMENVVYLIDQGADINQLMMHNDILMTPLDIAEQRKHSDIADYLRTVHRARRSSDMPEKLRRKSQVEIEEQVNKFKIDSEELQSNMIKDAEESDDEDKTVPVKETLEQEAQTTARSFTKNDLLHKTSNTSSIGEYNSESAEVFTKQMVDDLIKKVHHDNGLDSMEEDEIFKKVTNGIDDESPEITERKVKRVQNRPSRTKQSLDKSAPTNRAKRLIQEGSLERSKSDYDLLVEHEKKSGSNRLSKNKVEARILHEKAIFDELTHLKKTQLQYGKVQEKILVRTLIDNFCKMHRLPSESFKFTTFYAWEKFLYDSLTDQLKIIYLEERERIHLNQSFVPKSSTSTFHSKIRNATPLNEKIRELSKIYSSSKLSLIGNAKLPPNRIPKTVTSSYSNQQKNLKNCNCKEQKK
uniref:ANK_REP_REGION domain-containing protein n=1 Tax=Rhabditophanes sp. KR3021 TaxID=114890 RepID=A0AC35UGW3_9BILA